MIWASRCASWLCRRASEAHASRTGTSVGLQSLNPTGPQAELDLRAVVSAERRLAQFKKMNIGVLVTGVDQPR